MEKYRILSLDGGGSWALIQVMALMDLYPEAETGHAVLRNFDLAAANSGGSIALGGLVEDLPLKELLAFFLSEAMRKSIFVEKLHLPYTPKYSASRKLAGLQKAFPRRGRWMLPEAADDIRSASTGRPVHLLITGFDYDRSRSRFFRSASASGPGYGDGDPAQVGLAEAIHASTNAPVLFFDGPAMLPSEPGKRYWDGAISGCNNPVLAGVAEAIVLGQRPEEIVALSIGTGTVCRPVAPADGDASVLYTPRARSWFLRDLMELAGAIVDDPPDAASFLAHVMTGGAPAQPGPADSRSENRPDSRIVRMSPMIAPVRDATGTWRLPPGLNEDAFSALASLAMDAVEQKQVLAIEHLAGEWLRDNVRNQPIRMNESLERELGQDWYSQAKAAWRAIA